MVNDLSCSVRLHKEDLDGKKVFVADCSELDVSDFGDSPEEALSNLRKGINLLLEVAPEKRGLLIKKKPVETTLLFL